jgi:hypothetical protein
VVVCGVSRIAVTGVREAIHLGKRVPALEGQSRVCDDVVGAARVHRDTFSIGHAL